MKLFVVRHATALDQIGGAVRNDYDRPLVDEGRKEAELVATALRKIGVKGDAFLTSPLVRARQTAEIFAEVLAGKDGADKLEIAQAMAPGGDMDSLYKEIRAVKNADEVFLFGHMPDVTDICAKLLWCDENFNMPFKKSAVACINVYDLPPTSPGELRWFITPKIAKSLL